VPGGYGDEVTEVRAVRETFLKRRPMEAGRTKEDLLTGQAIVVQFCPHP
jgi:hypothetical protein